MLKIGSPGRPVCEHSKLAQPVLSFPTNSSRSAHDAIDAPDYALAVLAFALPTILGLVLWLMFGGWLPENGVPRRSRPCRGPKQI